MTLWGGAISQPLFEHEEKHLLQARLVGNIIGAKPEHQMEPAYTRNLKRATKLEGRLETNIPEKVLYSSSVDVCAVWTEEYEPEQIETSGMKRMEFRTETGMDYRIKRGLVSHTLKLLNVQVR